jgi:hypothetical protein
LKPTLKKYFLDQRFAAEQKSRHNWRRCGAPPASQERRQRQQASMFFVSPFDTLLEHERENTRAELIGESNRKVLSA